MLVFVRHVESVRSQNYGNCPTLFACISTASPFIICLFLWARPPRASESLTHLAPPAGVGCVGGDRRPPATLKPLQSRSAKAPLPPRAAQGHRSKNHPSHSSHSIIFVSLRLKGGVTFMSTEDKQVKVEQASKLAKWFRIHIEISLFDKVIWSKTWPPQD